MVLKHDNGRAVFIFDQESDVQVYLAGDFNNWEAEEDPMELVNGKWQLTKTLRPGAYQFKYVIYSEKEQWFNDWRADAYVKSPFGGENSVIIIE